MKRVEIIHILVAIDMPRYDDEHPARVILKEFTLISLSPTPYWPRREKTCLGGCANNKGADQPALLRRLISAFVLSLSESIISRLATREISIF